MHKALTAVRGIQWAVTSATYIAVLSCVSCWTKQAARESRQAIEICVGEAQAQGAEYLQLFKVGLSVKEDLENRLEDALGKLSESSTELADTKAGLEKSQLEHEVTCCCLMLQST